MTLTGRDDVDAGNHIAVLDARGILNPHELICLRLIEVSSRQVRQARGLKTGLGVAGIWAALQSAASRFAWSPTTDGSPASFAGDRARLLLMRLREGFSAAGQIDRLDRIMRIALGEAGELVSRIVRRNKSLAEARQLAAELTDLHDGLAFAIAVLRQSRQPERRIGSRRAVRENRRSPVAS